MTSAGVAAMTAQPVAIVGLACRLPQAPGPGEFWRLLRDGVSAITEVPAWRWNAAEVPGPDRPPPAEQARTGGFLDQVDKFDPGSSGFLRARPPPWTRSSGWCSS